MRRTTRTRCTLPPRLWRSRRNPKGMSLTPEQEREYEAAEHVLTRARVYQSGVADLITSEYVSDREVEVAAVILQSGPGMLHPTEVDIRYILADETARQKLYRDAARRLHPDSPTGNHELFVRLQQANAMLEGQAT